MKYLVVKAILGFGDRLEYLKMCVDYALKYDILLAIDWRDKTWGLTFEKYFLLNFPVVDVSEIPTDLSVFPGFWAGRLNDVLTKEMVVSDNLDIGQLTKPLPFDVIVAVCTGKRTIYSDSGFFASRFRITDFRVIDQVKQRILKYDLFNKWGIHLRGTDRASTLDYKQKRLSELSIRLVGHGLFNGANLIVVSDDAEYIKMWKERFPEFPVITNLDSDTGVIGRHLTDSPKDERNVELLVDFFTLMACQRVYSSSPDSRFAKEAQRLAPYVRTILGM
jgi:hypothetical protein